MEPPYIIGDNFLYRKLKVNQSLKFSRSPTEPKIYNTGLYHYFVKNNLLSKGQDLDRLNLKNEEWRGQKPSKWKNESKLMLVPLINPQWVVDYKPSKGIRGFDKLKESTNCAHEVDLIGRKGRVDWNKPDLRSSYNLKAAKHEDISSKKIVHQNKELTLFEDRKRLGTVRKQYSKLDTNERIFPIVDSSLTNSYDGLYSIKEFNKQDKRNNNHKCNIHSDTIEENEKKEKSKKDFLNHENFYKKTNVFNPTSVSLNFNNNLYSNIIKGESNYYRNQIMNHFSNC
jgi:hypothetical protein